MILPLAVLRRLDCVLEPTKADVLARYAALSHVQNVEPVLRTVAGDASDSPQGVWQLADRGS